ncbi:pseudouridine synthase [Congregibacter sp.]|uniref:pseudouridine synthase n=1 Tax=Congregibacter sp. TaxID=2744308 RepID=UPI003F6BB7A7
MPRLDKQLSTVTGTPRKALRLMLAQGRVTVDQIVARDASQAVGKFSHIAVDGKTVQNKEPCYLMLHKPGGVVCATKDPRHKTVLDLIDHPLKDELHIVGRLDYHSTGLVLLTNDGVWSRQLSLPDQGLLKRYLVTTEKSITRDCLKAFAEGMFFAFEGITTRPAELRIIDAHTAEVALTEGRYHQIKRMFGRFDNKVLSIHRFAVGAYHLGPLAPGTTVAVPKDPRLALTLPPTVCSAPARR